MKIIFTKHAKEMIEKRKITEDEVIQTIKHSEKLTKIDGLYYAQKNIIRANIEVVYEKVKYIKVVTLYYL